MHDQFCKRELVTGHQVRWIWLPKNYEQAIFGSKLKSCFHQTLREFKKIAFVDGSDFLQELITNQTTASQEFSEETVAWFSPFCFGGTIFDVDVVTVNLCFLTSSDSLEHI